MKIKRIQILGVGVLLIVLLSSCLPGGGNYSPDDTAGFFSGIWHGWIAPFSLIVGFF